MKWLMIGIFSLSWQALALEGCFELLAKKYPSLKFELDKDVKRPIKIVSKDPQAYTVRAGDRDDKKAFWSFDLTDENTGKRENFRFEHVNKKPTEGFVQLSIGQQTYNFKLRPKCLLTKFQGVTWSHCYTVWKFLLRNSAPYTAKSFLFACERYWQQLHGFGLFRHHNNDLFQLSDGYATGKKYMDFCSKKENKKRIECSTMKMLYDAASTDCDKVARAAKSMVGLSTLTDYHKFLMTKASVDFSEGVANELVKVWPRTCHPIKSEFNPYLDKFNPKKGPSRDTKDPTKQD